MNKTFSLCGLCAFLCLIAAPAYAEQQSFEQALAQAYLNNPSLQAERARLRAVDEQVSQALSGYRPTIDATGSAGKSYAEGGVSGIAPATLTPRSFGVQISQPLFKGLRTVAGVRAAEAQIKAGRANLQSAEQQLLLDAGTAFLDVVENQSVVELDENNEDVLRKQLEATHDRFTVGEVTRTDVSQAESRLQRAIADKVQAEGILANKRATFARLVGDMPTSLGAPKLELVPLKDEEEAIHLAESKNPNVLAASANVEAANENVTVARGSLLPEVNLVGSGSRAWDQSSFAPLRQDSAQVLAQVTVPLYRSGADYSRTRAANQTVTQYRMTLEDTRNRARESAIGAWRQLVATRAAIKADKAGVDANDIALRGVREEATVGTRNTLDVLNAEQELLNAKVSLVQATHDEAVAILQVRAAIGALTAEAMNLPIQAAYDPQHHYDAVRNKWAGFGNEDEK